MKPLSFSHLSIKKVKRPKDRQNPLWDVMDFNALQSDKCPKCLHALYWNRMRTIIRCKSKLHSFVLTEKAYDEIISGKRLEQWKEQDTLNRR